MLLTDLCVLQVIEYNAALLALFGTNAGKIKSEYVYRDTGNGDTRDHISVRIGTVNLCFMLSTTRLPLVTHV